MIHIVEQFGRRRAAAVIKESTGPVRTVTDQPDPEWRPRPVGFTAQLEPAPEPPEALDQETPAS